MTVKDRAELTTGLLKYYQPYRFLPSAERTRKLVISNLKGSCVLDAGCGNGWLSICAWEKGFKVISLDVAKEQTKRSLLISKYKNTDIKLVRASLANLPFLDSTFDSIMCINALEHIYDIKEAISEMNRVLKEGGRLILMIPNRLTFGLFYDRIIYRFMPAWKIRSRVNKITYSLTEHDILALALNGKEPVGHCQEFTKASIRKLLNEGRFKRVNFINCRFLSPYLGSLCNLLGSSPMLTFELFDNRIVNSIPSILATDWVITCDKG